MLLAGKVLAATAIRLFSDSALLEASQRELAGAGRTSLPLPDSGGGETVGFTITIRPDRS
jgi:hypothetical protein